MSAHAISAETMPAKKIPAPLNGVSTPALFATIDVVKNQPQLGAFQFRARGDWLGGTHMHTTMSDFSGAGGEHSHKSAYMAEADHPAVLCGQDNGADAGRVRAARTRRLLHGRHRKHRRSSWHHAAFRDLRRWRVTWTCVASWASPRTVRNGFSGMRVRFDIKGDAPEAKLQEVVQQACARSAVLDILTNGVPITVETNT